jgi:hypothetical protein
MVISAKLLFKMCFGFQKVYVFSWTLRSFLKYYTQEYKWNILFIFLKRFINLFSVEMD